MAEKVSFAFRMMYEKRDDGCPRANEIAIDTLYGKGRLKRR
ncbi:hypothetical protein [Albidovulum sediminis]|uniref:Transposase n=1 Tax=Albidovulum sediminis TaxID=3066345 RepID=A0ABT2NNJ0_9RHOB|nr:hypothetical protein [Defluviimonas sediminis]MCT8330507.1 hypothetical protein [Defluviimonas sediminis]